MVKHLTLSNQKKNTRPIFAPRPGRLVMCASKKNILC